MLYTVLVILFKQLVPPQEARTMIDELVTSMMYYTYVTQGGFLGRIEDTLTRVALLGVTLIFGCTQHTVLTLDFRC